MINLTKISPPKSLDDLRKKFGVGKYKKKVSTINKKLIRNGLINSTPPYSFGVDVKTKKLKLTYTIKIPKQRNGVFVRNTFTSEIQLFSQNKELYLGDYKLPFDKNTFENFVSKVVVKHKEINDEIKKIQNNYSQSSPLIETYVSDFLNEKKSTTTPQTQLNYEKILSYFTLFLKRNSHQKYFIFTPQQMEKVKKDNPNIKGYLDSDFTTKMGLESFNGMDGRNIIISWINQIQKPSKEREYGGLEFTQSKPTTIKSYYIVVRCFFNWLDRNGYIDSNPIKKITPQDLPHFSTYDRIVRNRLTPNDYDIECIWKWINDEIENPPLVGRWNKTRKSYLWIIPMIVVWMKTGIRNNTCCKLELKNVNWETGLVKYITKGSVGGVFYLDDTLRNFLKPLVLDENNQRIYNRKYLFSSEYVKKRMNTIVKGVLYNKEKCYSPQTTSQYFNKITSEIKQTNENFNDEITIHSFRRYYINKSIRMGIPLSSIRKSINHNDYRSIMKYESDILDENELKISTLPNPFETTNKDDELNNIHKEIDELKKKRDKLLNQQQTRKSV